MPTPGTWRVVSTLTWSPIKNMPTAEVKNNNAVRFDQAILNFNKKAFDTTDGIGE